MANTRTAFVIRPVEPADLAAWLSLVNQVRYWQDDVEALQFDETLRPADEPVLRLGAWTTDDELAGVAEAALSEDGSRYEDRAAGMVGVAASYRRHGLGARLADEVEGFAIANHVRWVEAEVRAGFRSCGLASRAKGLKPWPFQPSTRPVRGTSSID